MDHASIVIIAKMDRYYISSVNLLNVLIFILATVSLPADHVSISANELEEIRVQGFPIPTIKFIKAGNNSIGDCDGERTEAAKNMLCSALGRQCQ